MSAKLLIACVLSVGLAGVVPGMVAPAAAPAERTLGADHPKGPVNNEDWAAGYADIVNDASRVHGYWVNFEDVFFFAGGADGFNEFLTRCDRLPNAELIVIVHPGRLDVRSPWDEKPRELSAQWSAYTSLMAVDRATNIPRRAERFTIRVDLWLDGAVKLENVVIPQDAGVKSGGEIEAFVRRHGVADDDC